MKKFDKQTSRSSQLSSSKPRKKYRSTFLTNLFEVLESEGYSNLIRWSRDGTQVELLKPDELAATAFPKMYKHSNLASFTKQLNMYRFQRLSNPKDSKMVFYHPLFQKGRNDLMLKIDRAHVNQTKKSPKRIQIDENYQGSQHFQTSKNIKPSLLPSKQENINLYDLSVTQSNDQSKVFSEVYQQQSGFDSDQNDSQNTEAENRTDLELFNPKVGQMTKDESKFETGFKLLLQIACNSRGNIEGTHLPVGFYEFQNVLEKMLGFDEIDDIEFPDPFQIK